jgi:hypothetical protein
MSQYLCESVAFDQLCHKSSLRADKSTQVQRKHSFQTNLDFTYRNRVFQSSRYRPVFCQKTRYGSSPQKKLGKPIFVPDITVWKIRLSHPLGLCCSYESTLSSCWVLLSCSFRDSCNLSPFYHDTCT